MPLADTLSSIVGGDLVMLGLLGGIILASFNAAGAAPVLFMRKISRKFLDTGLGFAAGVMLAASFTSLIVPGIERGGAIPVLVGIAAGTFIVTLTDKVMPHVHFIGGPEGHRSSRMTAAWLFAIAVTIHNMPEGLAVGVGFGTGDVSSAIALMIAIGTQNVPEGMAIAFSLLATEKYSRRKSYLIALSSGLVEVPMSLLGAWAVVAISALLPFGMGFAAGAMIFVIVDEILPEVNLLGHEKISSYGLIVGLILMLALDTML